MQVKKQEEGVSLTVAVIGIAIAAFVAYGQGKSAERERAYLAMRAEIDKCTDDCSGHEAGIEWAKENNITDVDDCPWGRSKSFHNGCLQKVYREMEDSPIPDYD